MKKNRILIIGAALAGPTAAARAREIDESAEITLLERNTRVSYSLAGLSFYLSKEVVSLDELNREREEFFRNVYNINVLTQTEVIQINRKEKSVLIRLSDQQTKILEYDSLIFATGASSVRPEGLPEISNFRYFRTLDDLAEIRKNLDSNSNRFIILGGGSMGLEAMDGIIRGGGSVDLIEKNSHILPDFGESISKLVESSLSKKIRLHVGYKDLQYLTEGDKLTGVIIDGIKIDADFMIVAIGVKPRTELLKESGIKLNSNGSVPIDSYCRTSDKNIYACSICVSVPKSWSDEGWITQAAVADKTAQIAGANSAGLKLQLGKFVSSMIVRIPEGEIGRVGMTESQIIKKLGNKKLGKILIQSNQVEPYMPESKPIFLELYYNKKNGKVLGLEGFGNGLKSRLDSCGVAIQKGMTIEELSQMDFAYSPAFSTTRDALNISATVGWTHELNLSQSIHPNKVLKDRNKYFIVNVGTQLESNPLIDLHLPLESLRNEWKKILENFLKSNAKSCLVVSESGRRGQLALRILEKKNFPVRNISGGLKLLRIYANQ